MVYGLWFMVFGSWFMVNVFGCIYGLPEFRKKSHTLFLLPSRACVPEARVSGHGELPQAAAAARAAFVLRPVKRGFGQLRMHRARNEAGPS